MADTENEKNNNDKKKNKDFTKIPPGGLQTFGEKVYKLTIRIIVFVFLGGSFSYLTKIVDRTGLGGTDANKAPYRSKVGLMGCGVNDAKNFFQKNKGKMQDYGEKMMSRMNLSDEFKSKIRDKAGKMTEKFEEKAHLKKEKFNAKKYIKHSLEEWSFPYKNNVLCNKSNIYYEPLRYRFTRWIVETLIYSYSYGRQGLSFLFDFFTGEGEYVSGENMAFWIGPVLVYLLVYISLIYGVGSHLVGGIANYGKLIPRFIFTWWWPLTTLFLSMTLLFVMPLVGGVVQSFSLIFFLVIYPLMETEKFPVKVGKETKDLYGFSYIWRTIRNNLRYILVLYFAILSSYAFTDLNTLYGGIGIFITLFTYFF